MTTEVVVKATHGWPVEVAGIGAGAGEAPATVEPGETAVFHVHAGLDLVVREIQPGDAASAGEEPMLRHFGWSHLRADLKAVSQPFGLLARRIVATVPRSACLRKLLEAKDCALRAALER